MSNAYDARILYAWACVVAALGFSRSFFFFPPVGTSWYDRKDDTQVRWDESSAGGDTAARDGIGDALARCISDSYWTVIEQILSITFGNFNLFENSQTFFYPISRCRQLGVWLF